MKTTKPGIMLFKVLSSSRSVSKSKMSHIHSGIQAKPQTHWFSLEIRSQLEFTDFWQFAFHIEWICWITQIHPKREKSHALAMKYLYQNGYWTYSGQQDTASTTLKPLKLKWGMGFIEQRPCSHPRYALILKPPVGSGRASCPIPHHQPHRESS